MIAVDYDFLSRAIAFWCGVGLMGIMFLAVIGIGLWIAVSSRRDSKRREDA